MFDKLIENWELFIALIVSISAFIAIFMSAPTEASSSIYKLFYSIINYFAFNFGKAKNYDDASNNTNESSDK